MTAPGLNSGSQERISSARVAASPLSIHAKSIGAGGFQARELPRTTVTGSPWQASSAVAAKPGSISTVHRCPWPLTASAYPIRAAVCPV